MKLSETAYDNRETGCCARLDPEQWDAREIRWVDQPFATDRVRALLHIPLNFGKVMTRLHAAVEAAEAYPDELVWLSDESSPWGSDLYLRTDRDVPGLTMTRMSGRFVAKVFEGPFKEAPKWHKAMQGYVTSRGWTPGKTYSWYATCPKCAKKLGKNHVVLLTRIG